MTVRQQLRSARSRLSGLPAGNLEAEILLAYCLEAPRSLLYANPEMELSNQRREFFQSLVERRVRGEPIAYITGVREFWSLSLRVTPDVLIPRPETEQLVEAALAHIPQDATWRIADLGTGSGALALALASERSHCEVHGTDSSAAALAVAADNARRLAIDNVRFHHGSWCGPLEGRVRLIVSNPPYVSGQDPHLEQGDCRFEPRQALTPGEDGLSAIRSITDAARDYLEEDGWLLLEHGPEQAAAVRGLLEAFSYTGISTTQDLLGHDRVTSGQLRH
jgi:release factor glutamine methyltransferase